ncbi:MAG: methyltransferase type 11 [Rhodobiaceae bacterium]|jgi:SAM-dependent methyltransferase|nr:methyltransferase type 11 [Rhodobiaceae bacterium]
MAVDITDLAEFYASPLGHHVQSVVCDGINRIWPKAASKDDVVLGYGYASPLVAPLWPNTHWHLLMPQQQGVLAQDGITGSQKPTILGHEGYWPVRDNSVNRLLVMHGLEAANHVERVLDEGWRVLQPNGRALFVVPNRRGLWARSDATPFGAGRPFSRSQLTQTLRRTGFVPAQMRPALMLPPSLPVRAMQSLRMGERAVSFILPHLGGVWLIEAIKQVPAPLSVQRARRARAGRRLAVPRPALSPKIN